MTVQVITYKEFLDLEFEHRGKLILPSKYYADDTLGIIKDRCFMPIEFSKRANAEGQLVVLPCKVGDTVFFTRWSFKNGKREIHTGIVRNVRYDSCDGTVSISDGEKYCIFGKTVFLTREAAEKALGGAEDGK